MLLTNITSIFVKKFARESPRRDSEKDGSPEERDPPGSIFRGRHVGDVSGAHGSDQCAAYHADKAKLDKLSNIMF